MRLLSRYLLRQLAAPFAFALAALTGFMLLNQVAKKFGALVGKGLEWSVIAEVFALSLPFIIAMTLPMAVLVAVLYAFTHLAADNEITAMRASGVSVLQLLRPVLAWGVVMAMVNFAFVDQVLPRSNARLRTLLVDINRKKPTFELREQVINEIPPSQYFLRAGRIDPATGRLRDVTIYDVSLQDTRRIIYADSGFMAYAPGRTDLTLRLYDGSVHQFKASDPETFQLTDFAINDIRVEDVFDELERNATEIARGDREMGTCELLGVVRESRREAAEARRHGRELVRRDLRRLLGLPPLAAPIAADSSAPGPGGYCAWWPAIRDFLLPETAEAQSTAHTPRLSTWSEVTTTMQRAESAERRANRYAVEAHKKWSISAACISFVLVGIAVALRFPRGGMGLVLGGAMFVFTLFYIGLTAGESLADRGIMSPALAMWWPNLLLVAVGIAGLIRVNRESGSTRGGDWQEVWDSVRRRFRRRRTVT